LRSTLASILAEQGKASSVFPLTEAFHDSLNDKENDAKLAILSALAKYKTEPAIAAIKTALKDRDQLVRRHAVSLLRQLDAGDFSEAIGTVQTGRTAAFYQRVVSASQQKLFATITTAKGVIKLELYPQDAPLTVNNFVTLARRGYFNGLAFHRVVPNFVIQGGDPRGTGDGGPGYAIRCEINMRPYGRGALGMALSGKDTGGSQWFITHAPQPHLDGGYTVFGQVVAGMNVVDRIARDDVMQRVVITSR
jgi:cyclophilin family peptidyl-prolyl cis-trans isomerase